MKKKRKKNDYHKLHIDTSQSHICLSPKGKKLSSNLNQLERRNPHLSTTYLQAEISLIK